MNGGVGGTLIVGGNVTNQAGNPNGFATLTGLTGRGSGANSTFDDFDLTASTLIMNGGTATTIAWTPVGVPTGLVPQVSDFTLTNFAVGTLTVTNSTTVTVGANSVLLLMNDLQIASGSVLKLGDSGVIHLRDTDLSELGRLQGYVAAGQLAVSSSDARKEVKVKTIAGVGISLYAWLPPPRGVMILLK